MPKPYRTSAWHKPAKEDLQAAEGKTVPDLIRLDLTVLFCGINPSLYSAVVGHHFARPGNRFWPTLHRAGLTDRMLSPFEDKELLRLGYGITNVVDRATARADELSREELLAGGRQLEEKLACYRPRCLAVLGIGAYRMAFQRPQAKWGRQDERIAGAPVWVLPNPSGLNASFQLPDLARLFGEMAEAINGSENLSASVHQQT